MRSKFFFFLLLLGVSSAMTFAQPVRRVYIALDVSGSMQWNNRYDLGNYAAQMVYSLCDSDDEVFLIIGGNARNVGSLKEIQKPISAYSSIDPYDTQFGDIVGFNRIYKPSTKKQDWLFIIGDGEWETESRKEYSSDVNKFRATVESGKLNVCFLQTHDHLNSVSDFLKYVESMGIVDVKKADTSRQSIKSGCNYFARSILGYSETNIDVKSSGTKSVILNSELPLSGFQVLYQDDVVSNKLPVLVSAEVDGESLISTLKGDPSTTPLRSTSSLSGGVWRVEAVGGIPAGKDIVITFDKPVEVKNLSVFPIVHIDFSSVGIDVSGKPLVQVGSNIYCIERTEKTATVRIAVNTSMASFPESLMKKSKVIVHANNKDYTAKFVKGGFEAKIDIIDEETQYYADIDCPGYFKKRTEIITLRKGDCKPVEPNPVYETKKLKTLDFGHVTFDQLNDAEMRLTISDELTKEVLDPEKFNLDIPESGYLYDVEKKIEGDNVVLVIHPKGRWCECLFPLNIDMTLTATPKPGAFDDVGKSYTVLESPIHLVVDKTREWFPRCKWLVFTIGFLVLFLIYIWSLLKKRRFKKNARVISSYYDYYGSKKKGGERYLRDTGFGAWLKRWFSPVDERVHLFLNKPRVNSFKIVASDSKEMVNIEKSALASKTMSLSGYNPDDSDQDKGKFVKLADGESIDVFKSGGGREGELVYISGEGDDGALFRIFLSLLSVIDILAIVALVALMFRAL